MVCVSTSLEGVPDLMLLSLRKRAKMLVRGTRTPACIFFLVERKLGLGESGMSALPASEGNSDKVRLSAR